MWTSLNADGKGTHNAVHLQSLAYLLKESQRQKVNILCYATKLFAHGAGLGKVICCA
jgi:hypothetical protein